MMQKHWKGLNDNVCRHLHEGDKFDLFRLRSFNIFFHQKKEGREDISLMTHINDLYYGFSLT